MWHRSFRVICDIDFSAIFPPFSPISLMGEKTVILPPLGILDYSELFDGTSGANQWPYGEE